MQIPDDELRSLVREAIARAGGGIAAAPHAVPAFHVHASHLRLPLARGSEGDGGACLIEPSVRCNHCGYCLSLGY
jgi:hypothetical protein